MAILKFVLGGASSGKSEFAENLLKDCSNVAYIATMIIENNDEEVSEKIIKHRQRRPDHWQTFEKYELLSEQLNKIHSNFDGIIIDCLTIYISKLYIDNGESSDFEDIKKEMDMLYDTIQKTNATVVIVAQEVGMGIVPNNHSARKFREISGEANKFVADKADDVWMVAAGLPIKMK